MPIQFEHVSHTYSTGTPYEYKALNDVCLEIEEGKITAIIGMTGSGKSTLVQHLNALLLPESGTIRILERTITASEKPKNLKSLRGDVGLVFQFPEYQLFEETVIKDVAFGPKNFGAKEEEAVTRAKKALAMVGLPPETYEKSPLELSGGQKRRAAIAGILAMDPKILVLDEPTAGQDFRHYTDIMEFLKDINSRGITIIMITHDMHLMLEYAERALVFTDGRIIADDTSAEILTNPVITEKASLKETSLYHLALMCGIDDPSEFVQHLINYDREVRS